MPRSIHGRGSSRHQEGRQQVMKSHLAAAIAISIFLAGCSGYRPAPAAFHEAINEPYIVDAGDRIRVTVFEQETLTNTYAVDQSGYIAFPLVGAIAARGYTCLLYTSPSPRDLSTSRMPSSA